jgi:hypothetical protein
MANNIAKITGMVVRETARGYHNTRLFSGLISRKYNDEFAQEGAKVGETIFVRKPAKFRIRSGANQEIQDVVETKIPVTLPAQVGADFSFSTRELTLDIDSGKREYSDRTIVPAGSAIASSKDAEGLQLAALNAGFTVVTPATPSLADFTAAKAFLNKMLAPKGMDSRFAIVGSDVESAVANEVKVLYNNAKEITTAIRENELHSIGGLTWASSDLVYVRTNGAGGLAVTLGAVIVPDYANETQTITIAGAGAPSVAVGDTLVFNTHFVNPETKQVYVNAMQRKVLAKPSASTVTVYSVRPVIAAPATPAARAQAAAANCEALPANGSTISVLGVAGTKYLVSVVLQKEAMCLTSVDLVIPEDGVAMKDKILIDGMSIRFLKAYSIGDDTLPSRLDTLSAFTALYPEWIVAVETPLA